MMIGDNREQHSMRFKYFALPFIFEKKSHVQFTKCRTCVLFSRTNVSVSYHSTDIREQEY